MVFSICDVSGNQVHVNGLVSFGQPFPSASPVLFPIKGVQIAIIAPFWADIDLTYTTTGKIWYNEYSRSSDDIGIEPIDARSHSLFTRAKHDVQEVHGDTGFTPTNVIVVTWQGVPPYGSNQPANNQVDY